jgi:hypothetical protein
VWKAGWCSSSQDPSYPLGCLATNHEHGVGLVCGPGGEGPVTPGVSTPLLLTPLVWQIGGT